MRLSVQGSICEVASKQPHLSVAFLDPARTFYLGLSIHYQGPYTAYTPIEGYQEDPCSHLFIAGAVSQRPRAIGFACGSLIFSEY